MPGTLTATERRYIELMPKAELHVHLEGSVYPETLIDLAAKHQVALPIRDVEEAREWFRFRDFGHFMEIYLAVLHVLLDEEDHERVTWELAERAHQQNVRYLEVTFSPSSFITPIRDITADQILAGMRAGRKRAKDELGVEMQFILDPVRTRTPEDVMMFARWFGDNLGDGLIGFGLGGMEVGYPPDLFLDAFTWAKDAGGRLSLHAGETDGPASIRSALAAGSERIGHGVTCIHDPDLVKRLADEQIVLEVSPTSNVRLGVVPEYAQHPFRALHEAGIPVTVNSDDPPMFDTTLTNEYLVLAEQFDFSLEELEAISLRAVEAAFLPAAERETMASTFRSAFEELRRDLP